MVCVCVCVCVRTVGGTIAVICMDDMFGAIQCRVSRRFGDMWQHAYRNARRAGPCRAVSGTHTNHPVYLNICRYVYH